MTHYTFGTVTDCTDVLHDSSDKRPVRPLVLYLLNVYPLFPFPEMVRKMERLVAHKRHR